LFFPPIWNKPKIAKSCQLGIKPLPPRASHQQQQGAKASPDAAVADWQEALPGFCDDWQEYRLGQIFTERTETNRLDLRLLSITGDQGVIYRDDVGRKDTSSEDKFKVQKLCPGDIGYNTMRMWQGVSALSDKEGIVSPAYTILVPGKKAHPEFMAYFFKLPPIIHTFYRFSQGLVSDTWNLKYTHFKQIKVTIPQRPRAGKNCVCSENGRYGNCQPASATAKNCSSKKKALMATTPDRQTRVKV